MASKVLQDGGVGSSPVVRLLLADAIGARELVSHRAD